MAITKIGPESFRGQQHNKPLEITGQQMFDEKLLIYIKTLCRQVLIQEKKIGSLAVQEISVG